MGLSASRQGRRDRPRNRPATNRALPVYPHERRRQTIQNSWSWESYPAYALSPHPATHRHSHSIRGTNAHRNPHQHGRPLRPAAGRWPGPKQITGIYSLAEPRDPGCHQVHICLITLTYVRENNCVVRWELGGKWESETILAFCA